MIIACGNRPEESSVATQLPTPLMNRVLKVDVRAPSVDDWADWMDRVYGENWDKTVYAFLKRFETEGQYFMDVPRTPETLNAYPTPRTWTAVSVLMNEGFRDRTTINGLVGQEKGSKLKAFLDVNVDLDEVIETPELFLDQNLNAKFMITLMLSTWISNRVKKKKKKDEVTNAMPLIDVMTEASNEFLLLLCTVMEKQKLIPFIRALGEYDQKYKDRLEEIVLEMKQHITK